MTFEYNFWDKKNLNKPDISCLRQDYEYYESLLFQVSGKIDYDVDGLRFSESAIAAQKFEFYFDLCLKKNVDLAITPEYSCPWEQITRILENGKFPLNEKVWIIGSASIKPKLLNEIITKYSGFTWIYDEDLVN